MRRIICWFLGHTKHYVGIRTIEDGSEKCPHGWWFRSYCCYNKAVTRWYCTRCEVLGEGIIKDAYKVHFGELVLDEKKWAEIPKRLH